ncbi:MAG TPA: type II toxin-antitoxin system Phd/YefM family antitoxin [Chloroflexota bacterium]|jgi:prevent-host-death family protein
MRVVGINTVRQDTSRVIREAQKSDEPTLVVTRSQPAAYIVGAAQYEALRREVFAQGVEAAEAEARTHPLPVFESADELMHAIQHARGE